MGFNRKAVLNFPQPSFEGGCGEHSKNLGIIPKKEKKRRKKISPTLSLNLLFRGVGVCCNCTLLNKSFGNIHERVIILTHPANFDV